MSAARDLAVALLEAVRTVPGVRPAVPVRAPGSTWTRWDWDNLAVDVRDEVVQVELIATRLPLPPLLGAVDAALRPVLAGTAWADARLRLVVTDLDRAAVPPH